MSYKKFDQADLEVIKNIIKDDERILYAENINEEYSHDELGGAQSYPDVVVKATSAEEISEIMKYAYENNIPVTPRGAGTDRCGFLSWIWWVEEIMIFHIGSKFH